jgi:aminopeptidase N
MLHTLLGPDGFRKGTDLYFSRHDHQAVTTEDFVKAMEDATGADLRQFRRWYTQAGTPRLEVTRSYDAKARTYRLAIKQSIPPTPGQPVKKPMHIPVAVGLLGRNRRELPLQLNGRRSDSSGTIVLNLRKETESFVFTGIPEEPVPSLLRHFSAPVKVSMDLTDEELLFLMAYDGDEFNRWDAGQQLAVKLILGLVKDRQQGRPLALDDGFINAFSKILESKMEDKAFQAFALSLPAESYLADFMPVIDPTAIHEARRFVMRTLAGALRQTLLAVYYTNQDTGPYRPDQEAVGRRSLKNTCLTYLMELNEPGVRKLCQEQFQTAGNMTDVVAALAALANTDCPERQQALDSFLQKWKDDQLVMDKWLSIQALSSLPETLSRVRTLMDHPAFNVRNPNKVRALIGAFTQGNSLRFHDPGGEGYVFLADSVLMLDPMNPQIAARLVSPFTLWKRYDEQRAQLMKAQLERIIRAPNLSKDVHEIVSKSLA